MTAGIGQFAAIQAVAPLMRIELHPINVRDAAEIERRRPDISARLEGRPDRNVEPVGDASS